MSNNHRGEIFTILGALAFAFNGVVSKIVLKNGLSEWRLTEIRCGGAFAILFLFVFLKNKTSLRVQRKELPWLFFYGIIGFAAVQVGYFIAIARMHVSIALIIEFTAPIWIVLWIKYVRKKAVPRDMWIAISLALLGLLLLAQVWQGMTLDGIGLIAAFLDAFALTGYFLLSEKLTPTRSVFSLTVWGLGFATLAWIVCLPLWSFPVEIFTAHMNLEGVLNNYSMSGWVLLLWVIIPGTIVPYLLVLTGLKELSASTSSVIGMLEPVFAGIVAWIWIGESWTFIQLLGGAIVIAGIFIADRARSKVKR